MNVMKIKLHLMPSKKNNNLAVDCACKRSVGSLSNTKPNNNNATISVSTANRTVSLIATKNIRNNSEIFLSYGNNYKINNGSHHTTK